MYRVVVLITASGIACCAASLKRAVVIILIRFADIVGARIIGVIIESVSFREASIVEIASRFIYAIVVLNLLTPSHRRSRRPISLTGGNHVSSYVPGFGATLE